MILVKKIVIKNPTIISKFARGNTSISSPSYVFSPIKQSCSTLAYSGRICKIATLINSAPANVDPNILSFGFDLNAFDLIGNVPMYETITKNNIINNTFKIDIKTSSYISCSLFIFHEIIIIKLSHFIFLYQIHTQLVRFEIQIKMNMKKLIEEADFDNVEQISKRWKKDVKSSSIKQSSADLAEILNAKETQKENVSNSNIPKLNETPEKESNIKHDSDLSTITNQTNNRKRQVIPQVMDQDTEHFKNRLQHLLNTFKTDAIGEFMGMKKAMLDYQKQTIKGDTQKYLQMYEEKHQQLITTKQSLIEASKELEKKTIQVELMSSHINKLNDRIKAIKYLSKPFSMLYQNKVQEKTLKVKYVQAQRSDNRRMIVKAFGGWRNIWREAQQQKEKQNSQKRINDEVKDIVTRLNKEMQMLRQQLNTAVLKNQQYENNKLLVQENLKKAFLRGMCAMNMEAMGVLGAQSEVGNNSMMQNSLSMTQMMNTSQFNQTNIKSNLGQSVNIPMDQNPSSLTNNSIYVGKVKTESKQHKWKQAPVMGIEQSDECEEPRPILVKPSTEGKVIRVIDGKSSTVDPKKTLLPGCSKINPTNNTKQSYTNRSFTNSRKNI